MTTLLAEAEAARRGGRYRKAIAGYRRALAQDPNDASIHARLAPLLAQRGRFDEALASFLLAARDQVRRGFLDKAIGLYQSAARYVPHDPTLWGEMAELHVKRGRFADAIQVLLEGARHLSRRRDRAHAVALLRRAFELDSYHVDVTLELAAALRRSGERAEAWKLLDALVILVDAPIQRRVRAALFRVRPTPATFWRWLRA